MLDFLQSVSEFFQAIGSFVMNLVEGVIFLITMIPEAMGTITLAFGYMPAMLVTFATAGIAICIVFHLIGR